MSELFRLYQAKLLKMLQAIMQQVSKFLLFADSVYLLTLTLQLKLQADI